jgi:serine protease AprX
VSVVSLRSSPILSLTGVLGIESGEDLRTLTPAQLPYYTTSSGTSFSAPQVAGAIALMLEVNPQLTPAQIADILQRTASPIPGSFQHEVGAGLLNVHAAVLESAFAARRMGEFRGALDRGQVRFVQEPVASFARAAIPGRTDSLSFTLPEHTVRASLEVAWGPLLSVNDLGLTVYGPGGGLYAQSNTLNLLGLTGRRERVDFDEPTAGQWRATVAHTLPVGTQQGYTAALQVARVQYAAIGDLTGLSDADADAVRAAVRTFTMTLDGRLFRPSNPVSRVGLAQSMVLAGRAPQYLAGAPRYTDVRDRPRRLWVESVQSAPGGPFFPDAAPGGLFDPFGAATRLAAAVALVRAAGFDAEATVRAGATLPFVDADAIPSQWRGYVAVAVERGLLAGHASSFGPGGAITRLELARALDILATLPLRS